MVNWTAPENGKFEMDTGYTLRARELRGNYHKNNIFLIL